MSKQNPVEKVSILAERFHFFKEILFTPKIKNFKHSERGLGIALKNISHIKKFHMFLNHHECMKKNIQKLNCSPEKYCKCGKN